MTSPLPRARARAGGALQILAAVLVTCGSLLAQEAAPAVGGDIRGVVKSGNMALPGVTVGAANTLTGQKVVTWTDVNGGYALHVAADGRYVVRTQMAAFATGTGEVLINAANRSPRMDLELVLLSRAQEASQTEPGQAAGNGGFRSLSVTQGEGGPDFGANASSDQAVPPDVPVPGINASVLEELFKFDSHFRADLLVADFPTQLLLQLLRYFGQLFTLLS